MSTWTDQYNKSDIMFPTEPLIRMFKGRNYPNCDLFEKNFVDSTLLDVGCGDANNFILYDQLGFKNLNGVEITQEICDLNKERLDRLGIEATFKVGTNDHIPYEEAFDFLVSWNACYYMGVESRYFKFEEYMAEFHSKLNENGIFIFSVPASDHRIFRDSIEIDDKYTMIQNDPLGIRKGVVFRKFRDETDLEDTLSNFFTNIHLGEVNDNYFGTVAHWYIGYAYRK